MAVRKTARQLIEFHEKMATYWESRSSEYAAKARVSREKAERMKREAAEVVGA